MTLPVIGTGGFGRLRKYITRIVAKTDTTVTVSAGLLFDLPAELKPALRPGGRYAERVGIEDLTVDGADCPSGNCLVSIGQSHACWVRNVTVRNGERRLLGLDGALQCEIRHCDIYGRKVAAQPNSGGLFVMMSTGCLIEDNILQGTIWICPNGDVNACGYDDEQSNFVYGNILEQSIEEIWNGKRRQEVIFQIAHRHVQCYPCNNPRCCRQYDYGEV